MGLHSNFKWLIASLLFLFGYHSAAQETATIFPEIYNSEPQGVEPLSPEAALASLRLPSGFSASLYAKEPQVQNPIAGTVDALGRVWIAENYTYAERSQRFDLNLHDRVVVLEDRDGDGVAEQRTVFSDSLQMLTGIAVGQGGVWLMCPPQLLFIPDGDGDLIPDGPPQVMLDGFHVARENYHNFANGLSWGPDSWLYGRCGASCPGELGLPGTTAEQRIPLRGGIWRYDPQRQVVEALNQGTTNPWGHDWNALGELFFINTVNGHLWHSIPGAHYVRPHSLDANPRSFEWIDMHADHWHFDTGKSWTDSRDGAANDFGGGHAHVGMMIYQETTWPSEYQQRLMTVNMHGRRINVERLDAQGSGYVGRHEPDFVMSDDTWFRGMDLLPLPDGNVLMLDWSDTGECHDSTGVHRTSGRIFKITYDKKQQPSGDGLSTLSEKDPAALAELQSSSSEWHARRAREQLRALRVQVRSGGQAIDLSTAEAAMRSLLDSPAPEPLRLRALWALWAMDGLQQNHLLELCDDRQACVRLWAVRLLSDRWGIDTTTGQRPPDVGNEVVVDPTTVAKLIAMAGGEPDARVRLVLASTLQRMPIESRASLATALMSHAEDAEDHNLPLMVWYGLIPLCQKIQVSDFGHAEESQLKAQRLETLVAVAAQSQWPRTRRLIVRSLAGEIDAAPQAIAQLIDVASSSRNRDLAIDVVIGTARGLAGRRQVVMPKGWQNLLKLIGSTQTGDTDVSALPDAINDLNVLFGDGVAIDELKRLVLDESAPMDERRSALSSLVDSRADGLRDLCLQLLKQRYLNVVAARGLASEQDDEIGERLLANYRTFAPLDRPAVISILASRKNWGRLLLNAIGEAKVDRTELTPFQARQLSSFHDQQLDDLLVEHWGQARATDEARIEQMVALRSVLTTNRLAAADRQQGRLLFTRTCAGCHTLYGEGGKLAPDLTGAGRSNLDYLLENIVDPSAVVTKEFRTTVAVLEDGRVLTGLMTDKTDKVLTLATQEQTLRLPLAEITEWKQSAASTMPEGLLNQLSEQQVADLFAYLQSTHQVALP